MWFTKDLYATYLDWRDMVVHCGDFVDIGGNWKGVGYSLKLLASDICKHGNIEQIIVHTATLPVH